MSEGGSIPGDVLEDELEDVLGDVVGGAVEVVAEVSLVNVVAELATTLALVPPPAETELPPKTMRVARATIRGLGVAEGKVAGKQI